MKVYSCQVLIDGYGVTLSNIDQMDMAEQVGKAVESILKVRWPTSSYSTIHVKDFFTSEVWIE